MTDHRSIHSTLTVDGGPLSIPRLCHIVRAPNLIRFDLSPELPQRMQASVDFVEKAVEQNRSIYGVTTGFGGMANVPVNRELAAGLQNNLLSFLAAGAGDAIDRRHVRAAMILRANVLAQGCSGVRYEIVKRLLQFVESDATPLVREFGSIGASGDLVPLSAIARAITGQSDFVKVQIGDHILDNKTALAELGLDRLELLPKEGLALVNGTSFSAAIAANCVFETRSLMALTLGIQAMMLRALCVQQEPFGEFVQQKKPHPGQVWSARIMQRLLSEGCETNDAQSIHVQDRYSLRCLPQYFGSIVESLARITDVVETEMNSVSDNPLIDTRDGTFHQSGNFLGQYIALAMDDLRRDIGLMAKHLDVQIATLVAPEFSGGLPASLQGNPDLVYNMGLKGLQITGNSIMPMLSWYANSIVEHFPTHAEQFNQNINGLSWGSSNLAWKSVETFRHYLAVAMIFAVQAVDLRAKNSLGHYDGRAMIGTLLLPIYEAAYAAMNCLPGESKPFLFDDRDQWLEGRLELLYKDMVEHGDLMESIKPILESFDESF